MTVTIILTILLAGIFYLNLWTWPIKVAVIAIFLGYLISAAVRFKHDKFLFAINLLLASIMLVNFGLAPLVQETQPKIVAHTKFKQEKINSLNLRTRAHAPMPKDAIGYLDVPSVKLHLPIFNELTNDSLAHGAAVMQQGMHPGHSNFALAGHYMTTQGDLFSPIAKIKPGKKIYVKTLHRTYVYQAQLNIKIPPTDTKVLRKTKKPRITLITCADGGQNRYLVVGKLIK